MNFEDAFNALNPEQKAAAAHIDGPMMVLAGPGTGKTQIVALRIAKILKETQLAPHNILCLTFTESGVAAMRRRLLEFIGTASYYVRICTFHAFCNDIIKENPEKFLFARELEPLTDIERVQLFKALFDELPEASPLRPFGAPYFYQKDVMKMLQDLKREDLTPDQLDEVLKTVDLTLKTHKTALEHFVSIHGGSLKEEEVLNMQNLLQSTFFAGAFAGLDLSEKKARTEAKNNVKAIFQEATAQWPKQKALVDFYRRYQQELRARGRYDYEDMILFTVEKLRTDAPLLARLQEQFQYILVDEYQDTNGAQNEVVRLLGSYYENPNIFVVGDDKQSIYRFQGASLENMVDFYHRFKSSIELVTLQNNYRSQQSVLDAASSLIRHNEQGLESLIPELEQHLTSSTELPAQNVQIAELQTPADERFFLAQKVKELIAQGTNPAEIAIFFRNNRDSEALAELFARLQIPFHLYSGKNLLDDPELQKLLGLLDWLADPLNDRKLFFLLHYDFLHLPTLEILKLTRAAADQKKSLWELLSTASPEFKSFQEKAAQWQATAINKTFSEFFEFLLNDSGFLPELLAKENRLEHLNRLNTFFDQVKQWNRANPRLGLQEFTEYLTLLRENDLPINEAELQTQKNAVALMTAHRSKGLEFEHVFIMQCVDKHWGNNPSRAKLKLPPGLLKTVDLLRKEKNEDERRLFYVALTRAKKTLTLTLAKESETGREEVPSLFLAELSPDVLNKVDTTDMESKAELRLESNFLPLPKSSSADEESFVRSLLQNYTMSVTHLNNYLKCPRRFYYENLLRVPRAKSKQEAFGTAIHEALKDLLLSLHEDPTPSEELLQNSFERHLHHEILLPRDHAAILAFGRQTLHDYFEHYRDTFHPNTLLEFNFSSHHVHVGSVPITGKLDKIEILDPDKKTVHTVDYKTGNPDSSAEKLGPQGAYRRQIIFYQLLCDLSQEFPYTMVSGEIDFVQKSSKDHSFVRRRFEVTPEEKEALIASIQDVYSDIQALKFLHPDEWTVCGECEYCLAFKEPSPSTSVTAHNSGQHEER